MSDVRPPFGGDQSPVPPARRNGCLTAIMVIVGIILLLPGLCALIIAAGTFSSSSVNSTVLGFVLLALLVGAFGIYLISKAIAGPRR